MQVKRNVINLTAWVHPEEKKLWEKDRLKEGLGWSEWIKQKVRMAMNFDQLPVYNGEDLYELKEELRKKEQMIESLYDELYQQENTGMNVLPEERLFKVLKQNRSYTDINEVYGLYLKNICDEIKLEYLIPVLQEMTIEGKTECDRTGNKWRLKNKTTNDLYQGGSKN